MHGSSTWAAPLYPSSAPAQESLPLLPLPAPTPALMTAPAYSTPLHANKAAKDDINGWIKEAPTTNILIIVALTLCVVLALWAAKLSYNISLLDRTLTMMSGRRC